MKPAARLGLYGAALAVIFGAALLAGNMLVPDALARDRTSAVEDQVMDDGDAPTGHTAPEVTP